MTESTFWPVLDRLVATSKIVIDRPKGSPHPRHPSFRYPLDYGYLQGTLAPDGDGIDVWVGSLGPISSTTPTVTGIIVVLTFVGLPFYLKAAKEGFESISPKLEKVSRSLGASMFGTFLRITFPIAWRSLLVGLILCMARAISEFGAVVVVAYHPMVASVLIYERFEAFGLKYSQPVAVWLVAVCLILFLALRVLTLRRKIEA